MAIPPAKRNFLILCTVALFPLLAICALFVFRDSGEKRAVAEQAVYAAQTSSAVAAEIGLPMQPGWPIRGNVVTRKGEGHAELQIPLNGSHGKGVLLERAQQNQKRWRLCSLEFRSDSGKRLTLVDAASTHCAAE
jgi:hypothetical protein